MPNGHHGGLYRCRCCRVLLLWITCHLASSGLRGADCQEGGIWHRPSWIVCVTYFTVSCKSNAMHAFNLNPMINYIKLPAKFIFVRILRGSRHLTTNTVTHWTTWIGSTFCVSLVAYIIASGIPVFGELVSLIGALLGTLLSFQPMGGMWLYDNWNSERRGTPRWYAGVCWSVFVIVSGTFFMIVGTYSTIVTIVDSSSRGKVWSCADNSNST